MASLLRAAASRVRFARTTGRQFHASTSYNTDGVFRELTAQRVQTPWVEALRKKQAEGIDPSRPTGIPTVPTDRKLEPKRMSGSYHSVILPLARDPWLLDTYMNSSGHIRLGTIFMDLDALSGVIAYKHTGDSVTTVTAACDRITINQPLTEICDLELSGQVTYATGRSSMEISIQVARAPAEGQKVQPQDILLTCTFTMVSLDPGTRRSVNVPAVLPSTPDETRMYERGARASQKRKASSQTALLKHTPNDEESDLVHALWQRELQYHDPNDALRKPANVLDMAATVMSSAAIMQPQFRNRHHFMIFGGFLLKKTFELAFCCAAAAARTRPTFVSLDPSIFMNPVPVGSVLYLTATVVYTDPALVAGEDDEAAAVAEEARGSRKYTRVQVRVDSKVRDVEHGSTKPTGQFNYTFTVDRDVKVMPRTYSEFMMYVDARRRAKLVREQIATGEEGTGRNVDAGEVDRMIE